jgi:hypothetical protein
MNILPKDSISFDVDNENELNDKSWKEYHENILIDWADKALCYRWLYSKSNAKYVFLRNAFTIPVIIMSTLTGTANFAIERIPKEYQSYCQVGIGSINILAGIITTIAQFLKINELCEAHRVSTIGWEKFYRNIRMELVKCPEDRTDVDYLIKSSKDEFDRLMETSPNITDDIIKKFNKTFKNKIKKNENGEEGLSKPEILDSLESTRNIVFKEEVEETNSKNLITILKEKKEQKEKEKIIENFIETFNIEYSRKPSIIEIYDNLDLKIPKETIDKYVTNNYNK